MKLVPERQSQVTHTNINERGRSRKTLRSLMVFSGYVKLWGKATVPEGLNLCGPGASATENKQCLPVIRTLLRHTKSPSLDGVYVQGEGPETMQAGHFDQHRWSKKMTLFFPENSFIKSLFHWQSYAVFCFFIHEKKKNPKKALQTIKKDDFIILSQLIMFVLLTPECTQLASIDLPYNHYHSD